MAKSWIGKWDFKEMIKTPFEVEIKNIDLKQQQIAARTLGLPIPKHEIKTSRRKATKFENGLASIFNGILVSEIALFGALTFGVVDADIFKDIMRNGVTDVLLSQPICTHRVKGNGVNVRSGPGINYSRSFQLNRGDKVSVVAYVPDVLGGTSRWAEVKTSEQHPSTRYYIRVDFLIKLSSSESCPIVRR